MSQARDIATSHLETMIERVTNMAKANPDDDGDYFLKTNHGGFFARIDGTETPILRIFTIISKDIDHSPDLLTELNAINCRLTFPRVFWVGGQVLMESNALALDTTTDEFNAMCSEVANASDAFGPKIVSEFGGTAFFEQSKEVGQGEDPAPPSTPGYI
jgi:hypothetical protein